MSEYGDIRLLVGDCLPLMRGMADDSVDLIVTSPPYEDARTYDVDFGLKGQDWVDWAVERFIECCRVSRGLVAWVVEGRTRNFRWSATPALMMTDLHRRGVHLRKPPIFHRIGIPGSGGPDWWRNDAEWVICASKGKLPWSDNTATGNKPVWAVGGAMSNRTAGGQRRNAKTGAWLDRPPAERMTKVQTRRKPDGTRPRDGKYSMPTIANPGNVISVSIIPALLSHYELYKPNATILQELRQAVDTESTYEWGLGIALTILGETLLRSNVHGRSEGDTFPPITSQREGAVCCPTEGDSRPVRLLRRGHESDTAPSGWRPNEQRGKQPECTLSLVPQFVAQRITWVGLPDLRWEELCRGFVPQALQPLETAWRSACEMLEYSLGYSGERGDVIKCRVGGGAMGHVLAHENEAPFPESFVEPFIRCFCPPGGIIVDPFCGSGTVLAVARKWNRGAIGIDLRRSQIELAERRVFDSAYNPSAA